jgi:hypothetical protein
MGIPKELGEFLHKIVDGLAIHENTKKDLHTELTAKSDVPDDTKDAGNATA